MLRRFTSHLLPILALLIPISGCAHEKVFTAKSFAPLPNDALQPASRLSEQWWPERHQAILDRNKKGGVDLILVGDSITNGWDDAALWAQYFAPRHAVNMGFSGDRTQHVLWRFEHGELDGISPKVAMVMIGTNNSNGNDNTAEQIADGIVAICRELRTRLPETKIVLLAIFPRGEKPDAQRAKNARASLLASSIADGKTIFYMDINDRFLKPDGTLTADIMPDYLHPNAKGYQIWADAVLPKVDELMKGRRD